MRACYIAEPMRSMATVVAALVVGSSPACVGSGGGHVPRPEDPRLSGVDDCGGFRSPALEQVLDDVSVARDGNAVDLLINGVEAFERRYENTRDADVVLVKTFIYSDDEVGRRVSELLIDRVRAGARVILQYDVKGSISSAADAGEMIDNAPEGRVVGHRRHIQRLIDAGVEVIPASSPTRAYELHEWSTNVERLLRDPGAAIDRSLESMKILKHSDHEKYWITGERRDDGTFELTAILGGMNIASEYAYGGTDRVDAETERGGWRDVDIEVRGPIVNDIVDRFFDAAEYHIDGETGTLRREQWNTPQSVAGTARVRFAYNHPLVEQRRAIERAYVALIDATPRGGVVRLETAYYAPGKRIRKALRRALRRGTRVAIVTNSPLTNDIAVVADASRFAFYALLEEPGVAALYERKPREDIGENTLHAKVASFGSCGPVIVGSANLDSQSAEHNSESVVMVWDEALRTEFDRMYEQDIAADRVERITIEHARRSGTWEQVRQWATLHLGGYWL